MIGPLLIPLEQRCGQCYGTGLSPRNVVEACPNCGGRGVTPTDFGKALLEFIDHHCLRNRDRRLETLEMSVYKPARRIRVRKTRMANA